MRTATAVVTGASAGIGAAFARRLAADGHRVIAVARHEDALRSLVAALGPGHTYVAADLATEEGRGRVCELFASERVQLLVNNAGTAVHGRFADVPVDGALGMTGLNVDALVTLAHGFLGRAEAGDTLLNVSSAMAYMAAPELAVYGATKAFVASFSRSLRAEYKGTGVRVRALCPGMTATESQPHDDAPAFLVQPPGQVVDAALRGWGRGRDRAVVIPGVTNRLFSAGARVLAALAQR